MFIVGHTTGVKVRMFIVGHTKGSKVRMFTVGHITGVKSGCLLWDTQQA